MKKTIATALLIGALSLSSAPAFAETMDTYPAPSATPNTVNGVVPESSQPTPAPTTEAQAPDTLPNTGVDGLMYVWGGVGALALIAGVASVIHVRRKAQA